MLVIDPARVAEVLVTEEALPVVTIGALFTPEPVTGTWIPEVVPPPPTGMFPLYDCVATGVNFTKTCWVKLPPVCGIFNVAL